MSAVFPWSFFQDSLLSASSSFIDNRNLIKESNFPHYLIPVSIILTNTIIFLPSLLIIIIPSLVLKGFSMFILFLPIVLALHLAMAAGLSIILSLLYVKWRDIKFILEIILLLLFYLTPAVYPLSLVKASFPPGLFKIYLLNPLVCILNLYRITLLKNFFVVIQKDTGLLVLIISPFVFTILVLIISFYVYKKNRKNINDYLSY